jgi:DNA-binding NarL/FixJ family response regulator
VDRRGLGGTALGRERAGEAEERPDVLRLLAKGCTNRRIGELLGLSNRTVDMHVARILDRLGAGTRTEAALLAEEQGLLG